jgi:hypothetical protein
MFSRAMIAIRKFDAVCQCVEVSALVRLVAMTGKTAVGGRAARDKISLIDFARS